MIVRFYKEHKKLYVFLAIIITAYDLIGIADIFNTYFGEKNYKIDQAYCTDSTITMSPELIPYLNSFIADCKHYGLKYDHAYCLNSMRFGYPYKAQGVTDFDNCSIKINRYLADDSVGMKFVIYHELGHWFGLNHSKGIMQSSYNTREDMEWARDNWQELSFNHFLKLKEINNP